MFRVRADCAHSWPPSVPCCSELETTFFQCKGQYTPTIWDAVMLEGPVLTRAKHPQLPQTLNGTEGVQQTPRRSEPPMSWWGYRWASCSESQPHIKEIWIIYLCYSSTYSLQTRSGPGCSRHRANTLKEALSQSVHEMREGRKEASSPFYRWGTANKAQILKGI